MLIRNNDCLGNRMKNYEKKYSQTFFPYIPVIARLDGKAFHTFTHGLMKPYDKKFVELMQMTTKHLVKQTNARCGFTQSDEITLVWLTDDWKSEIFLAGKLQKMNSIIASMCTAYFNRMLITFLPDKEHEISGYEYSNQERIEGNIDKIPLFDCRVFQVPTEFEAANCFIWREKDATRNSVQMAARSLFSHNECENKDCSQLQEMLWQKGINWNDYPNYFKRGTYFRRRVIECKFTKDELEALPPKHAARTNPNLMVKRTIIVQEDFPPLAKLANREEVILHGADPIEN